MLRPAILIVLALSGVAGTAEAQSQVLPIAVTQTTLSTTSDRTQVPYYILELPVPEVPADCRLAEAYLEFFVDATSALSSDLTNGAVTLEVFPFSGTQGGKLDPSKLGTSSMKRSVVIGNDRKVRIYVTDFVRRILADPKGANRNVIVGSIAGARTGRFDAKPVPGSGLGAKALLTVNFRRNEEANATSK